MSVKAKSSSKCALYLETPQARAEGARLDFPIGQEWKVARQGRRSVQLSGGRTLCLYWSHRSDSNRGPAVYETFLAKRCASVGDGGGENPKVIRSNRLRQRVAHR